MENIKDEIRKANKEHVCDWCGDKIEKGEKYNHQTNKHEGKIYIWKNHIKCLKIAHYFDMFNQCDDGVDMDSFIDIIRDEFESQFSLKEKIDILYERKIKPKEVKQCQNTK